MVKVILKELILQNILKKFKITIPILLKNYLQLPHNGIISVYNKEIKLQNNYLLK